MASEHKWAEVLRGIAAGKVAEYYAYPEEKWMVLGSGSFPDFNPIQNASTSWRIRPEPKPEPMPDVTCYLDVSKGRWNTLLCPREKANLSVTFDVVTGQLKSAEVIK